MTMTHTPGPWVSRDSEIVAKQFGECVARIEFPGYKEKDIAEGMANARLIAAAPELLDTLKRILYAHDMKGNGAANGEAVLCPAYASMARHVIEKAT